MMTHSLSAALGRLGDYVLKYIFKSWLIFLCFCVLCLCRCVRLIGCKEYDHLTGECFCCICVFVLLLRCLGLPKDDQ